MRKIAFALILALGVSGIVAATRTQEGMELPKPGKEHELLKQFAGTWDAVGKMTMDPTQPPVESKSVDTTTLGCNGLWLISDVKGEFMGAPFHGHGVFGYDTQKKKYVGAWVDAMGTYIMLSEGTYDAEQKAFTWSSEGPMGKMKEVHTIKDKDTRASAFTITGKDGKETPMMTIDFKRRK